MPIPESQAGQASLQREGVKSLAALRAPRKAEVEALISEVERYDTERKAARAWATSYDDEVKAHAEAAEVFEKGLLLAEVGIVMASIALLLSSRPLWYVALALLFGAGGIAGRTYVHTRGEVHEAREKIDAAMEHYKELREAKDASGNRSAEAEDERLLLKVRERFGIAGAAELHK